MSKPPVLVAVMGPTGSGKSAIAESLAGVLNATLINADAFQVYRHFDIGTNKPPYPIKEKYKNIDIVDPDQDFGVGEWIRLTVDHLDQAWQAQQSVVIVGGTGFYVRALFENYDNLRPAPNQILRQQIQEDLANHGLQNLIKKLTNINPEVTQTLDLNNPVRVTRALEMALDPNPPITFRLPPFAKHKTATNLPDNLLKNNIETRTNDMFLAGWKQEVEQLLAKGLKKEAPAFRAIGYHLVVALCEGNVSLEDVKLEVVKQTWQYARRQKTWLRSEPGLKLLQTHTSGQFDVNDSVREILDSLH